MKKKEQQQKHRNDRLEYPAATVALFHELMQAKKK